MEHIATARRIVIDTKFCCIVASGSGWHGDEVLRTVCVYQIYDYLRKQEDSGEALAARASGMLLRPSVGDSVNEHVFFQGHEIRFATVDLAAESAEIRRQLLGVLNIGNVVSVPQ